MAELLSYVKNINSTIIKELLNKKIAIHVPTENMLIIVQDKLLSMDNTILKISDASYILDEYEDGVCITLNKDYKNISYSRIDWYKYHNYKIIEAEDILRWGY